MFINKFIVKKMQKMRNKKGQLTLWIIVAIIIVAAIVLLFAFRIPQRFILPSSPTVQLQDCIKSELTNALSLVEKRGGSINPMNSMMYNGEKVEYLCYINEYYKTCSNQQPLLKQHIEREILDAIKGKAQTCIDNLKSDLEARGYTVTERKQDISVSIEPNNIVVVFSGIDIKKESTSESYAKLEAKQASEIYDLIMLTTSILNWEARYGDSEITAYMSYYPGIKVEKYKQSDGSKIYILSSRNTDDKFVFATRSLSWPAGYGIGETYKPVT